MRPFIKALRIVGPAAAAVALLSGCSEYLARRDAISIHGGDALATNEVTHMVDPWPAASANHNIAFDGERMQTAVARYRTNRVIPPSGVGTSGAYGQSSAAPPSVPNSNGTPLGPTVNQVK